MGIADGLAHRLGYISLAEAKKKAEKPTEGEQATHGRAASLSYSKGTRDRIGTYNPDRITQTTFEKMERHFQVRVGLALLYLPLVSVRWSVSGSEPGVNEYVRAAIDPIWRGTVRSAVRTACSRGCAPHEIVWERQDVTVKDEAQGIDDVVTGWVPSKVKDIDPASLESILIDEWENFGGYEVSQPTGVVLDPDKCFHFAHDMQFGNWWGTSRLVGTYEPWYRQQLLWDYSMRYMERRGTPTTWVKYPPGTAPDGTKNEELAQAIATGLTTDDAALWTPAATPGTPEWDVSLLEDSSRSQGYLEMLNAHNTFILRSVLVPDKAFTQDAGVTGSLALSQTHYDMFLLGEDGLLQDILEAMNSQLVERMVRYTFGPDVPIPRLESQGLSDATQQYLGELFKLLVGQAAGAVDIGAIADQLGVPTLEADSAVETDGEEPETAATSETREILSDLRAVQQQAKLMLAAQGLR